VGRPRLVWSENFSTFVQYHGPKWPTSQTNTVAENHKAFAYGLATWMVGDRGRAIQFAGALIHNPSVADSGPSLTRFSMPSQARSCSLHSGHSIRTRSTRRSCAGVIEHPHFGQMVLSAALTFSRLIFCVCTREIVSRSRESFCCCDGYKPRAGRDATKKQTPATSRITGASSGR